MKTTIGGHLGLAAMTALWFLVSTSAGAMISSTFDLDREGWLASGDVASTVPTYLASGGNPGGTIEVNDQTIGGIWYYDAPDKFLGNKSAAYERMLSFDLWQTGSGPQFSASDVVLNGAGLMLTVDAGKNPLPLQTWVSYSVLLSETAGWVKVSSATSLAGPPATQAELLAVLESLDRLRIRGEFIDGTDRGRLDNVYLAIPEPAWLAGWTAGVFVFYRQRSRLHRAS